MTTASPESTAEELVELARAGDEVAFGVLARRHRDALHDRLLRLTRSEAMTEELTAETYLRAWDAMPDYRRPADDFGAWLRVLAHQAALDLLSSERYQRELSSGDMGYFDTASEAADTTFLADVTRGQVHAALDRLSEDQRTVVVQRFFDEKSIAEVARGLGRSEGAVKQLQFRATRRLAKMLPGDALLI